MKKQKIFILITSLMTAYVSLEAASQQDMTIARLDVKGQSIHRQELAKKEEAEQQKQYEAKRAEQQKIAAQQERKAKRSEKQEIESQRDLIHNLENKMDEENSFIGDSMPVSE